MPLGGWELFNRRCALHKQTARTHRADATPVGRAIWERARRNPEV
ncbi:MAG: hypothetical protein QHH75_04625 [Bacillota bacterium]|nr:hypothetical protein [Bacillota bacterium]